jgi:hypothetical protein
MKKSLMILAGVLFILFVIISGCKKSSPSSPGATDSPTINATETAAALETAGPSAQATATAAAQQTLTAQATATAKAQETATAEAQATETAVAAPGTISGTIIFQTSETGKQLFVGVLHNIDDIIGNPVEQISSIIGASTSVPYSITAPAGTYFVLAGSSSSQGAPAFGDCVGSYNASYPAFPASANVTVIAGQTTYNVNISANTVTNSIGGTATLPAAITVPNTNYFIAVTRTIPVFTDGQSFKDNSTAGEIQSMVSSGNTINYSLANLLPGSFYIEAFVDNDGSGTVSTGDYVGYAGPFTIDPASNYTGKNVTLSTQP